MHLGERFINCLELASLREVSLFSASTHLVVKRHAEQGTVTFDQWMVDAENVLSSCPRSHPGRPHLLFLLANEKVYRYDIVSHQESDLDAIITHLTEALLFPFHIVNSVSPFDSTGALYLFAWSLLRRFERTRQPPDLDYGIKCFRHLLYLPLRNTVIQFSKVSAELATALGYKTQLELDSEQKNIEEVLMLCLTCLPWDPSEEHTASVLARLALAVANRLCRTRQTERLEEVVGYLDEGRKLCQSKDFPELSIITAFVLTCQRYYTNVANDVQEIMTLFNENIPRFGHYALQLARIAMAQLVFPQSIGGNSLDRLVESINFCRATLNCLPPGPQYRPMLLFVLASMLRERYERFGHEESLKEADLCTEEVYSMCQSEELQSLRYTDNGPTGQLLSLMNADISIAGLEEEIRRSNDRFTVIRPGDGGHHRALLSHQLLYWIEYLHSNSLADLEEANKCYEILSSTANTHEDAINMTGNIQLAFLRSGQGELLDKSIDMFERP